MPWRLLVVDGADADRYFPLPESGTRVIGNSHKYCDICLHDLLMSRVHCQVETDDGKVTVVALAEDKDTLVNGQKVKTCDLQPGDVLRAGNSHIRLEVDTASVDDGEIIEDVEVAEEGDIAEVVAAVDEAEEVEVVDEPDPLPEFEWATLDQLAGHTFAHFEVGDVIGRGHFSVVFRARDTAAHREVALKVLSPAFPANPDELKQFAQTVRKVAAIHEEHLVRWWAAGRTSKLVWISQELVEGESLAEFMKKPEPVSKVRWRSALKLGADIAKALDCLFQRHIVHGDLRPANILLGLDRTAKLSDLMFEQAIQGSVWHSKQLEGKLLAELPYLPPERLNERGYRNEISDIYSLGALVYLRLTGRPPFEGATPNQIIEKIQDGRLEKPKKIYKECPMDFQLVIMKMLAVNPPDRYQTPADLLDAFESLQTMPSS